MLSVSASRTSIDCRSMRSRNSFTCFSFLHPPSVMQQPDHHSSCRNYDSFEFFSVSRRCVIATRRKCISWSPIGDKIADNASNGRQLLNRILSTRSRRSESGEIVSPRTNISPARSAKCELHNSVAGGFWVFIQLYSTVRSREKIIRSTAQRGKNHSISWRNVCRLCWFGFWSFAIFFLPFSKQLLFSFLTTTTAVRRARRNENFTYSIVEGSVLQQL